MEGKQVVNKYLKELF